MYHCLIKNVDADYYYLKDDENTEIGWCYETVKSRLFLGIASKIGFYGKNRQGITITVGEDNN